MYDPTLPVSLLMDNWSSHSKAELLPLYAHRIIRVVWIPPHFSHVLQPLKFALFRALRGRYHRASRKITRPQWQGKVLRIDCIWKSWAAAGIRPVAFAILRRHIDHEKIEETITEQCRSRNSQRHINKTKTGDVRLKLFSSFFLLLAHKKDER
jgi:hypothetical protein